MGFLVGPSKGCTRKMEMSALSEEESKALKQLRDKSLREQFIRGASETWVRRELRRTDISPNVTSFEEMRKEAILLFQESEMQPRRSRGPCCGS